MTTSFVVDECGAVEEGCWLGVGTSLCDSRSACALAGC